MNRRDFLFLISCLLIAFVILLMLLMGILPTIFHWTHPELTEMQMLQYHYALWQQWVILIGGLAVGFFLVERYK